MINKVSSDSHWFLVYTKPNQEKVAKDNLERQGVKVFLPLIAKYKNNDSSNSELKTEALFPRYLFIYLNPNIGDISFLVSTKGVANLVIFGDLSESSVPKEIIQEVKNLLNTNNIFEEKLIKEDYSPGDHLTIKKGKAKGIEAIFLSTSGKNRVRLLIQLINKSISADLSSDDVGQKEIIQTIKLTK